MRYAGARALLVTSWPVETTSARRLISGLFLRQEASSGLSRAQAEFSRANGRQASSCAYSVTSPSCTPAPLSRNEAFQSWA